MQEKGSLSVNTENLMPIIKKWLYSDRDIFLRELVSNGCDAISKLKKIASLGQADDVAEPCVTVKPDSAAGTLTISDNGIGMTAAEVGKYINQVAFSGAAEFMEKYEQEGDAASIIGHFGLGFYSAFMVADRVVINTLSFESGAASVRWESDGTTEYEMSDGDRTLHGTDIVLYLSDDSRDFLTDLELSKTLQKYCAFLPYPIMLSKEKEGGEPELRQVNDTQPLWLKTPSECTEEEYKKFYSRVFMEVNEPLFWIHLNVEYPFRLRGILYFPKLTENPDSMQGQIKLYNNQVFVADNIKEVIPEFLMLLKGVIDCPDMPLNVSRSFLQNDGTVKKISEHITKKIADKLTGMYANDRQLYCSYWNDIGVFIKYGCMRPGQDKFYDRMKDCIVFENTDGEFHTLPEYLDAAKEKHENKVYYYTNLIQQGQYVRLFKDNGIEVVRMDGVIDQPFIAFMETKYDNVKFARIDSDISGAAKDGTELPLCGEFKTLLDNGTEVTAKDIGSQLPALLLLEENNRRMQDLSRYYSGMDVASMFPSKYTLVLNTSSKLIQKLDKMPAGDDKSLIMRQVYDLAALANVPLTPERMSEFLQRSTLLLEKTVGED